ncbi:MAG: phosphoenolpyruvate carboxykinase (ATP) [Kofleriaceae bacterium]|nr:phosphoenolpyruvate carboxykinase (ATP) [Kofleriaceae bacterium]MBP6837544.1 phosphoenolpyruvate carboxykinase (ATP) [Kofleriaceae bacterium]MBP9204733.1 phosphoenolpyruvate carboxykinase (ATP) [Kofleriaceae bacterium]
MPFSLETHGITVPEVYRNASPAFLYEAALRFEKGTAISSTGAMIAFSGKKTGRSPTDKRVVDEPESRDDVWWGNVNIKLDPQSFVINRERAKDYLNTRERLFVVDGYAGWDPKYRLKIRIVCARAYHALFMHNMLIRPTAQELASFGTPDYVIYNAGGFPANRHTAGMTSATSVDLSFGQREFVILGTEYAGEMKKGVFTIMNYLMPKQGVLSMHCSATQARDGSDTSVLFGLSGTGKTTLSADPKRLLIGDDEHCWSDQGVFNIEGGCYAKVIDLSKEQEPDIWNSLTFGAVLENVVFEQESRVVDYHDVSVTQNTRGSYTLDVIPNAKLPAVGGHPKNVIFLTCDAFGVLPPVAKLAPAQAMYHFISGYTAKVAGTEVGVKDPEATFSPCFGGPFLVWHPTKYAEMLAEKLRRHGAQTWLVNTGWSGGGHGVGARMKLKYTRAIVDAIHSGALDQVATVEDPIFGLAVPTSCPEVPTEILVPRNTWADKAAYDAQAKKVAGLFRDNFKKYEGQASLEIKAAGPRL